ncbi:hypothetical protein BH10PSE7_BH10PSE7_34050 [soil metagenome]
MREYSKVSTTLWDSDKFTGLPSDDARLLFIYYLTCPHGNSAGCFKVSTAYATADLRWSPERYVDAREALVEAGLIEFDAENSVVLVVGWFRFNAPANASHLRGMEKFLEHVPSDNLREKCFALLDAKVAEIDAERKLAADAKIAAGVSQTSTSFNRSGFAKRGM